MCYSTGGPPTWPPSQHPTKKAKAKPKKKTQNDKKANSKPKQKSQKVTKKPKTKSKEKTPKVRTPREKEDASPAASPPVPSTSAASPSKVTRETYKAHVSFDCYLSLCIMDASTIFGDFF